MQMPFYPYCRSVMQLLSRVWLVCFISLVINQATLADEIANLYEASVPVESQDRELRTEAIRSAFREVLVRVSGRAELVDAMAYPALQAAIESATRYAQQYRYVRSPTDAGTGQESLQVWVRFDETAVSRLLRENHLPVWGSARPATLVWLVVDNRGQRELIGSDVRNAHYMTMQQRAALRGVPLRFPLLDLTDRAALRVSDVWGNFESTILRASERYQTEAVLVGRIFQGYSGSWSARWTLYVDSRRQDWSLNGQSIADVLHPGIDKTAESLAVRYAQVDHGDDASVLMHIKDINSLADYNRVVKYLGSLSHVSAVQTVELSTQGAIFRVDVPGGRLNVARAIALGHTLASVPVESVAVAQAQIPANPATTNPAAVPELVYRLVP